MGADKNVELVRAGYAAFSAGDMATLHGLFAEDAVWHSPGSGLMSGSKQGRDAILAFHAEREGKVIDYDNVNVFRISDGVVTEVGQFSQDTGESDAFWA